MLTAQSDKGLNMSFEGGSFASCNLFIIQIRYRYAWIVFSEKGRCPKFVKRKWKIENNDKEESRRSTVSF